MKILVVSFLFLILFAMAANADGLPVGQVGDENAVQYRTVRVVHDTTMRTIFDLSPVEVRFIDSVPRNEGLQDAVREMVLARVVHVPVWKVYRRGDSVHYWAIYQAWTGPAKATVPLIKGDQGDRGPRGRRGPKGDQGTPGQGVTNYYFGASAPMMSCPIGGQYAPIINNNQLAWMSVTPPSRINISVIADTSVGAITNTNNNANSNTNVNPNNNVINIGDGSASGSAAGTGTGTAQAGQ